MSVAALCRCSWPLAIGCGCWRGIPSAFVIDRGSPRSRCSPGMPGRDYGSIFQTHPAFIPPFSVVTPAEFRALYMDAFAMGPKVSRMPA